MIQENDRELIEKCFEKQCDMETIQLHFANQSRKDKAFLGAFGYLLQEEYLAKPVSEIPAKNIF